MNVLIVDDSVVFRMSISEALKDVTGLTICGTVSNGQIALDYFEKNEHPDLIVLDMEMPVMNGIETIKALREINKQVIIIVFSSQTRSGAEITLKALGLGANDFVTKQEASSTISMDESLKMIKSVLLPKINAFRTVINNARGFRKEPIQKLESSNINHTKIESSSLKVDLNRMINDIDISPEIFLIASSTGGPEALNTIFRGIKEKPKIPILLVQHMPPIFTNTLAQMLNKHTSFVEVKEAVDGENVEAGFCYIAPGDFHMTLTKDMKIKLNQDEKVSFVRPSATVLFQSVEKNFNHKTFTLILTGMGDDGALGLEGLVRRGDYAYIQDEATSIVWGMPSAARAKHPLIKELPLEEIPIMLNKVILKRNMKK
ncbi:MAG: two-component system chemotaxis response regulator CheB [Bacteriovoracaceae bacterium]|jgi:two-component system chemotaxis response regulator CheB